MVLRFLPAEPAVAIEYRQHCQAYARPRRRRENTTAHFRRITVGRALPVMMEIMKLPDRGESRLQHFQIKLGRDCFELLRRNRAQEAIHDLTPAPEAVRRRSRHFGKARHRALKGVGMHIGDTRHCIAPMDYIRFVRGSVSHRQNFPAIGDIKELISPPTV